MRKTRLKIIAIDDEPIILRIYRYFFRKIYHAEIRTTINPEKALNMAFHDPPHLFISDLFHPGINGISIIEKLRANKNTELTPIWIISGNAHTETGILADSIGADAVINKPFSTANLLSKANRLFQFVKNREEMLIDLGVETPDLDYKETVDLNSKNGRASFAKDVIAFANFGGGTIIVGVKERSRGIFLKIGIKINETKKYEVTNLNNAIKGYLDPPHFVESKITKIGNKYFVLIKIPPANETPIFPKKSNARANLFLGRLYTRSNCAESIEIQNSNEARNVIERIIRTQSQREKRG